MIHFIRKQQKLISVTVKCIMMITIHFVFKPDDFNLIATNISKIKKLNISQLAKFKMIIFSEMSC